MVDLKTLPEQVGKLLGPRGSHFAEILAAVVSIIALPIVAVTTEGDSIRKLATDFGIPQGQAWLFFLILGFVIVAGAWVLSARRRPKIARGSAEYFEIKVDQDVAQVDRQGIVADLLSYCKRTPIVDLQGDSGSGKSTLILKCLRPALIKENFLVVFVNDWGEDWIHDPAFAVREALNNKGFLASEDAGPPTSDNLPEFVEKTASAYRAVFEAAIAKNPGKKPILIFDQFDDYQTRHIGKFIKESAWLNAEELRGENPFWDAIAQLIAAEKIHCLFVCRSDSGSGLVSIREMGRSRSLVLRSLPRSRLRTLLDQLGDAKDPEGKAVIVDADFGWVQLCDTLERDICGGSELFLPQRLHMAIQGLRTLPFIDVTAYEANGRLLGLEAAFVRRCIDRTGADPATRKCLTAAVRSLCHKENEKPRPASLSTIEREIGKHLTQGQLTQLFAQLEDSQLVRPIARVEGREPVWTLWHDYLVSGVLEANRQLDPWLQALEAGKKQFDAVGGSLRARYAALLGIAQQTKLWIARLGGKFRYGPYRQYALFSIARFSVPIAIFLLAVIGIITLYQLDLGAEERALRYLGNIEISEQGAYMSSTTRKSLDELRADSEGARWEFVRLSIETRERSLSLMKQPTLLLHIATGGDEGTARLFARQLGTAPVDGPAEVFLATTTIHLYAGNMSAPLIEMLRHVMSGKVAKRMPDATEDLWVAAIKAHAAKDGAQAILQNLFDHWTRNVATSVPASVVSEVVMGLPAVAREKAATALIKVAAASSTPDDKGHAGISVLEYLLARDLRLGRVVKEMALPGKPADPLKTNVASGPAAVPFGSPSDPTGAFDRRLRRLREVMYGTDPKKTSGTPDTARTDTQQPAAPMTEEKLIAYRKHFYSFLEPRLHAISLFGACSDLAAGLARTIDQLSAGNRLRFIQWFLRHQDDTGFYKFARLQTAADRISFLDVASEVRRRTDYLMSNFPSRIRRSIRENCVEPKSLLMAPASGGGAPPSAERMMEAAFNSLILRGFVEAIARAPHDQAQAEEFGSEPFVQALREEDSAATAWALIIFDALGGRKQSQAWIELTSFAEYKLDLARLNVGGYGFVKLIHTISGANNAFDMKIRDFLRGKMVAETDEEALLVVLQAARAATLRLTEDDARLVVENLTKVERKEGDKEKWALSDSKLAIWRELAEIVDVEVSAKIWEWHMARLAQLSADDQLTMDRNLGAALTAFGRAPSDALKQQLWRLARRTLNRILEEGSSDKQGNQNADDAATSVSFARISSIPATNLAEFLITVRDSLRVCDKVDAAQQAVRLLSVADAQSSRWISAYGELIRGHSDGAFAAWARVAVQVPSFWLINAERRTSDKKDSSRGAAGTALERYNPDAASLLAEIERRADDAATNGADDAFVGDHWPPLAWLRAETDATEVREQLRRCQVKPVQPFADLLASP